MNRPKSIDHYVYIPREGEDVKKIILPDSEYCNGYYRNGNNYYIGYMKQVDSLRNPEPESIEGFLQCFKKYYEEIYNENDTYEFWIHFGQVGNEAPNDYSQLETRINDMRSDKLKSMVYFLPVSINGKYPADLCTENGKLIFPEKEPLHIPAISAPSPESEENASRECFDKPCKTGSAFLWRTEHFCLFLIAFFLLIWTLVPPIILFVPNTIDFKTKTVTIPLPFFYANENKPSNKTEPNGNTGNDSCVYVVESEKAFVPYLCLCLGFCFFTYALNLILVFILIQKLFRHYSRKMRLCRQHEFYGELESVIRKMEETVNLPGFPEASKRDVIKHANQLRERFVLSAIRLYFDGDDGE